MGAIPKLVVLGSVRKQAEQTLYGFQAHALLCLSSYPDFL